MRDDRALASDADSRPQPGRGFVSAVRSYFKGSLDHPSVFDVLDALGVMTATRPWFGGLGTVFVLHRACPDTERPLAPMFVTASTLDLMITTVKAAGWEILDLDAVARRVADPTAAAHPPFAAFTFDDGYLDNLTVALPVFRRHQAPLAIYLCTGFLDRLVDPWWSAVDRVIRERAEVILEPAEGEEKRLACGTRAEQESAYQQVWDALFSQDAQALGVQSRFYRRHKVDARAEMDRIALTWDQARELAADPLVTVGAHTVRHPVLTRLAPGDAEREMIDGRLRLESELGIAVRHFAYPFGLLGRREIELARATGFHTATTTHSGNLFAGQTRTLHCLPRRNFYENPAAIDPARARRFVRNSVRGCDLMVNAVRGRPRRITEDLWS